LATPLSTPPHHSSDLTVIPPVFTLDIPPAMDSYVPRFGRTGRAGRTGEAFLFVPPRERGMLRSIERFTNARLEEMELPTVDEVNAKRKENFANQIKIGRAHV